MSAATGRDALWDKGFRVAPFAAAVAVYLAPKTTVQPLMAR
jgi:hypothetical protein